MSEYLLNRSFDCPHGIHWILCGKCCLQISRGDLEKVREALDSAALEACDHGIFIRLPEHEEALAILDKALGNQ